MIVLSYYMPITACKGIEQLKQAIHLHRKHLIRCIRDRRYHDATTALDLIRDRTFHVGGFLGYRGKASMAKFANSNVDR
jgi:hypothetical protein